MKKLISVVLSTMVVCSAFAEAYSVAKYKQLKSNAKSAQINEYCYNAEVSKQTDTNHLVGYAVYILINNKNMTKDQIAKSLDKFKNISERIDNTIPTYLVVLYTKNNFLDEAVKLAEQINRADLYYRIALKYVKKDNNLLWKYGKKVLFIEGGYNDANACTKLIQTMFRYKPASVTKEQQIELLTKIADIYPIPGTDFSKWKAFMGFVGYKYKALTGKDLF